MELDIPECELTPSPAGAHTTAYLCPDDVIERIWDYTAANAERGEYCQPWYDTALGDGPVEVVVCSVPHDPYLRTVVVGDTLFALSTTHLDRFDRATLELLDTTPLR